MFKENLASGALEAAEKSEEKVGFKDIL